MSGDSEQRLNQRGVVGALSEAGLKCSGAQSQTHPRPPPEVSPGRLPGDSRSRPNCMVPVHDVSVQGLRSPRLADIGNLFRLLPTNEPKDQTQGKGNRCTDEQDAERQSEHQRQQDQRVSGAAEHGGSCRRSLGYHV